MSVEDAHEINKTFSSVNATSKSTSTHRLLTGILLVIGFVIILSTIGTVAYGLLSSKNEASTNNQIRSVFSGQELKDYHSADNKFTILMPGIPTIKQSSITSDDKEIPVTTYERTIENGAKVYTFAVYDYSDLTIGEPAALENSLNSALQNTSGAQVVSKITEQYNGLNSVEATYNVGNKDKLYEAHIRYVMKDSKMYAMILVGSDQDTFDQFANSLRLN